MIEYRIIIGVRKCHKEGMQLLHLPLKKKSVIRLRSEIYSVAPQKRRDKILDLYTRFASEIKVCADTKACKILYSLIRYMHFVFKLAAAINYSLTNSASALKIIATHVAHVGISTDTNKARYDILRCKGIDLTASAVLLNAPIILRINLQVINVI